MKVSVCIPVYGVEKYIERCARSLFEQTMKDGIEFIFVDDCTPDNSIEVLKKVLEEYPDRKNQVKIIRHEVNKGLTGARNTALQNVSGNYVSHCDSDDWVDTNLYETMYKKAIEEQADVVMCSFAVESKTTKHFYIDNVSIEYIFNNYFFKTGYNTPIWNKMFHRSIALNPELIVPHNITMAEDLLRVTQMLLYSKKLTVCNDVFYHYYLNPASVTNNYSRKTFENWIAVFDILQKILPENYVAQRNALAGQLILNGLFTKDVTSKEIRQKVTRKMHWQTLFCKLIEKKERIILAAAFVSMPITKSCVQILKAIIKMRRFSTDNQHD